ncbi:MAG: Asp23/Gls24 family envelope stress response protein [Opitutales bacterium]
MSAESQQQPEEHKIPTINDESPSSGEIRINHSVVASIVRLAALEVTGVHSVGGGSLKDGLAEMFTTKESERGVRVSMNEADEYVIELRVILKFGVELARVGTIIQQTISETVSRMTSKQVARVDVIIDGVKMDVPEPQQGRPEKHETQVGLHTD